MAQQFRALDTLTEDLGSCGDTQLSATPVPGDPAPTSGLPGQYTDTFAGKTPTCINKNKA